MKRFSRGFTLIELLVVIAIIGILASVVLVSLQSARKKGTDTRVISSVQQLRVAMESDYNGADYSNSFVPDAGAATYQFSTNAPYSTLIADIVTNGVGPVDVASYGLDTAITQATGATKGLIVVTDGVVVAGAWTTRPTRYALYGNLPSAAGGLASANKYFCIASTGETKQSMAAPVTFSDDCS